jgi:hypothetical protein
MSYSFRIRIHCSPVDKIESASSELRFEPPDVPSPVRLHTPSKEEALKDAEQLVLTGDGYADDATANRVGIAFERALTVALARCRIGADFGNRTGKGHWTDDGLVWLEERAGHRVLNSVHGLMTFETEPRRTGSTTCRSVQSNHAAIRIDL